MAEIIVLGAGLGGTLMAYELSDQLRKEDHITVIGSSSSYQFYPSNPWVAVGWRQRQDIEVDLSKVMQKKNIRFLTEGAKRVHPAENKVELNTGGVIAYDYLIIATGPELAFDEIPGLGPEAFTQSICETAHAEQAYAAFEEFCQNPGPIVIGAVQGVSCFGPVYEFAFILDTELRKRKIRHKVPMTFVTPEPYVGHLGLDGVGDTKGLMESELRERHIKWITNARVTEITGNAVQAEELNEDGSLKTAHELSFSFSMLMPPFRGVKAVSGIEGLTNPRGFILADAHQRNPAFPNVFSIGVCVAIPPTGKTPVPVGVPKTGFMIESMVTATAHNIGALLRAARILLQKAVKWGKQGYHTMFPATSPLCRPALPGGFCYFRALLSKWLSQHAPRESWSVPGILPDCQTIHNYKILLGFFVHFLKVYGVNKASQTKYLHSGCSSANIARISPAAAKHATKPP